MPNLGKVALACDEVADQLTIRLRSQGIQVLRSFDLKAARRGLKDPDDCSCPNHGTAQCNCQYVVLLINRPGSPPESIVAHGHGQQTVLSFHSQEDSINSREIEQVLYSVLADFVAHE
jgi:hypothetical protein